MNHQPWIWTSTKRRVNPLDLRPEDVCIEDIAHHLACTNRFAGALAHPVSVAQHSVCVARLLAPEWQIYGLLHDASEAYLGDVTKWLKMQDCMAEYRAAEDRAQRAVYQAFGLEPMDLDQVPNLEWADRLMVRAEAEHGLDIPRLNPDNDRYREVTEAEWAIIYKHCGRCASEMSWIHAKVHFESEFEMLMNLRRTA